MQQGILSRKAGWYVALFVVAAFSAFFLPKVAYALPNGWQPDLSIRVDWQPVEGATAYTFCLKDLDGANPTQCSVFDDNIREAHYDLRSRLVNLDHHYTYEVGILGGQYSGQTSQARPLSIDILRNYLVAPQFNANGHVTILTPAERTEERSPHFSWEVYPGALFYRVSVTDENGRNLVLNRNIHGNSFDLNGLSTGSYSFVIVAVGDAGRAVYSDSQRSIRSFRIVDPENREGAFDNTYRLTIYQPSGNIDTRRPTFDWERVSGAAGYNLNIQRQGDNGRWETIIQRQHIVENRYTLDGDLQNGRYTGWIQPYDAQGNVGTWGLPKVFIVNAGNQRNFHDVHPTLLAPSAAINDRTPTFSWNAVEGADHYLLSVTSPNGLTQFINENVQGTDYTPQDEMDYGEYSWKILAYYPDGSYASDWSSAMLFNIPRPDYRNIFPVLTTPNGRTADRTPTFRWEAVDGAVEYQLAVRKSNRVGEDINEVVRGTSYTPALNLDEGEYVWKVLAYGEGRSYVSNWAREVSFTIGAPAAGNALYDSTRAITFVAPNGQVNGVRTLFDWQDIPGATQYDVYVSNITTRENGFINTQVNGSNYADQQNLKAGVHRWWVRSHGPNDQLSSWYSGPQFTVVGQAQPQQEVVNAFNAATKPTLLSPTGNVESRRPSFRWQPVAGADHYELWVQTQGQNPVRRYNLQATSYTLDQDLQQGVQYSWYVRAAAGNTNGTWSNGMTFTIGAQQLAAPTVIGPQGNTAEVNPTFRWNPVAGAQHYEIWVNDITTGQGPVIWERELNNTSFRSNDPLVAGHHYKWWVWAADANNVDSAQTSAEFTITQ